MKKWSSLLALIFCVSVQPVTAQVTMREKVVLDTKNTVTLRGEITGQSILKAQLELASIYARRGLDTYPLYLVLDSPGGELDAGTDFIEFAKTVPNLHTVSMFAASMASAIAQALPGKRLVTNNGEMMFHRASGAFYGQFEVGELESRLYRSKKMVQRMESQNFTRMRMTREDYKRLTKDELWLDSDESLKFRAADKVVDLYCTKELIDGRTTLEIEMVFFNGTITFSKCPLFRYPVTNSPGLSLKDVGLSHLNKGLR